MSEFFKAATRCDATAAEKAPMYVDRTAIAEEEYRTQRLVEHTMRTELLLREIEEKHAAEASRKAALEASAAASNETYGCHSPPYRPPPQCTGHLPPDQRFEGSRAVQRSLNERSNLWRQHLDEHKQALRDAEGREANKEDELFVRRQREAEREHNALMVSRQIAARESELERTRAAEEAERTKRRAHPIDVLHQRIAEELSRDVTDASAALTEQLALDAMPIERVYEDEQMRSIRGFRREPLLHIPSAMNVTH